MLLQPFVTRHVATQLEEPEVPLEFSYAPFEAARR